MKRNRNNAGFSLIEMLCALVIVVLLVMGIGVGMDAGTKIYKEATFESESATLAGILNTALGDVLRYSIDVRDEDYLRQLHGDMVAVGLAEGEFQLPDDIQCYEENKFFVFTSVDYGIQEAYFYIAPHVSGTNMSTVQMKNRRNAKTVDLVNTGAYPDLLVSDFKILYSPRTGTGAEGGYFDVTYVIHSESDPTKTRDVQTIIRLMNG